MAKTYSEKVEKALKRGGKRLAVEPAFSRATAERAFRLAYTLHPERTTAARVVLQTLCDFPAVWGKTRVAIDSEEANLQAYLFAVSRIWEKDQELHADPQKRKCRGNSYCPTPEDMSVRYVELLVTRSIERGSFYAAVGLGHHLYQNDPLVRRLIHILPRESFPESYPETWKTYAECINRTAGNLQSSLRNRFPTTYHTIEWLQQDTSSQMAVLVCSCLGALKPWGTKCRKNGTSILDLFAGSSSQAARKEESERTRIHALIDTGCAGWSG